MAVGGISHHSTGTYNTLPPEYKLDGKASPTQRPPCVSDANLTPA
jgi:hypothetical protein